MNVFNPRYVAQGLEINEISRLYPTLALINSILKRMMMSGNLLMSKDRDIIWKRKTAVLWQLNY
ncbi:hypothetical protein C0Q44_00545 [Paenibacillus sp. PCH8]|nr:hypothetical protein C0Q44_00545 [Paenibacillus sp. PCH8]